ncbi:MAG TPA: beta-galactosidase [Solirubrobacteraceae bacterium]|nr:beta-galactosidase [Solirubrobacteraceae bacterium]
MIGRLSRGRRESAVAALALAGLVLGFATPASARGFDAANPRFGQPHKVSWDRYSLMIDGQGLAIWSGEFHYFRLPSPNLWRDVLEKIKAGGFNTVSLYFSWAYHSSAPGSYDFSGIRDVDRLLTMAEQAGVYVIARPGPYINAELDGGGFPGWLSTQLGAARTSAPDYTQAWMDYLSHLDPIIARHQITRGGSVIAYQVENELVNSPDKEPYMQALATKVRQDGIDVPTTANLVVAPTWEPVLDLAGPDIYPNGFACGSPQSWSSGLSLQIDHMEMNTRADGPATPGFIPEFQGGSFDPWGGFGYTACYQLTNGAFQKVLNQTATAQGVTMRNLYMVYGGTSWGWQAVPSDYTSYDYGAPIDEARELTPKYYDLKRMAYASAAVAPLSKTDSASKPTGSNSDLLYAARQNPDTHTQFIFLRHADPASTADASTTLSLSTPDGSYPTVPQQPGSAIAVHGRDTKMLIADYALGDAHLVYSTSELMTNASIFGRDVAVFYGARGDPGETVLRYANQPQVTVLEGKVDSTWDHTRGDLRLNYVHGGLARVLIHGGKRDLLLIFDDEQDSGRIWLSDTSAGPVLSYGPYLVRGAEISGGVLALRGDTSASFPTTGQLGGATNTSAWSAPLDRPAAPSPLRVLAGPAITGVTWNGSPVATRVESGAALAGSLPGPPAVSLPALGSWRFSAEAPEAQPSFQDSSWTKADHTTTNNVANPPDNLPVLYMDDYGFHYGNVWFRGHFTATGSETGISLDCASGGAPAECLIWFNGRFLAATSASGMQTHSFPAGSVMAGKDNVVSVLVENIGHPEDFVSGDLHKAPRGLRGASLQGSPAPLSWLIQGALGGEHPPDLVRGPLNTGGLFGERSGWHLPGFDDSSWTAVRLPDRWAARAVPPGVGWYRTSFSLNLPPGTDVPIGLRISDDPKFSYGALIFLNGWMVGQYANDVGPQHLFYLPEGILDAHGRNDLAIAVLSHGSDGSGGGLGTVSLQAYGRYRGGAAPSAAPARSRCVSRRRVAIRLRAPRGQTLVSARVYVNGRRVKVLRGRGLRRGGQRARIDLRGLPRGTVHVKIVERTSSGRRIVRHRTYHTCVRKRRHRSHR